MKKQNSPVLSSLTKVEIKPGLSIYIPEKANQEKRRKRFLANLEKRQHIPSMQTKVGKGLTL